MASGHRPVGRREVEVEKRMSKAEGRVIASWSHHRTEFFNGRQPPAAATANILSLAVGNGTGPRIEVHDRRVELPDETGLFIQRGSIVQVTQYLEALVTIWKGLVPRQFAEGRYGGACREQ